jgi:AmmeMemoRadiSam system protein A
VTALSATDRAALLGVARAAILERLGGPPAPPPPEAGPLGERRGVFVTVSVNGDLRGCIGTLRATEPLARTVARMAVAAAADDPRFEPLGTADVAELGIAISVLGEPFRLADPRGVKVGEHGLVVKKGWHRGVLLPKVATREGWDAETFLKHVCLKAGLPARAWQEPDTEIDAFVADEFGEEPT